MSLPTDPKARKEVPIASGFMDYFPDAVAEVAALSRGGNEQHNPGKPLQWDRDKSGDEDDALMRHFMERGTFDTDGIRHSAKVAWRAMALLQKELEKAYGLPLPRGARQSEDTLAHHIKAQADAYIFATEREILQQEVTRTEAPQEGIPAEYYWCEECGGLHDPYGGAISNPTSIPSASFPPFV